MPLSYKKNRAMNRILRNKFHAAPALRLQAAPETAASASYSLSAEIPKSYNDTYVRAIPKDPQSTFVYWEMPEKNAEGSGMEANGKTHTGNGEAAAIQNKVNGASNKPRSGGIENNNQNINIHHGNNQQDNNHNQGNNGHGQNQAQYYDFESNSWRNGDISQQRQRHNNGSEWNNIPHDYGNFQGDTQSYRNDSNDSGQNGQHQHVQQHHNDYGGHQDSRQTYQHDDNSRWRNGRHYRHGHDNQQHYQQQYHGNSGYYHILTQFTPPGNTGCLYMETFGIAIGTAVLTAERSIVLDICKSQVRPDAALTHCLSSGALYRKNAAPPPHLSSGILYNNSGAAGQL